LVASGSEGSSGFFGERTDRTYPSIANLVVQR
jgi:hypothetical protein